MVCLVRRSRLSVSLLHRLIVWLERHVRPCCACCYFFFNDPATTEIYTLSLHDALPICFGCGRAAGSRRRRVRDELQEHRSEEHTSELQSRQYLVCRLLLEKKNKLILLLHNVARF